MRHYRQPKASWLIAHRHIFFSDFFFLVILKIQHAVLASDLVPCIRPTLYPFLSVPRNRQASSVSSSLYFRRPGNTRVQVEPEKQAALC